MQRAAILVVAAILTFVLTATVATVLAGMETVVVEAPQQIPVLAETDVLVVGGSSGAVAAAVEAAKSGAKVFLIAPEPYLGADLCGTLRLWSEKDVAITMPLAKTVFAEVPPTPMHIKGTLAKALLDAKVDFLLESYPTDILDAGSADVAGVVIGNRSGRQAIIAKTVIDATSRAAVARMVGKFKDHPAGPASFSRILIGGEGSAEKNVDARTLPYSFKFKAKTFPVTEYRLTLALADGSFPSLAEAEQRARDLTWRKEQGMASDVVYHVPLDTIVSQKAVDRPWQGAATADVAAFRPEGVNNLLELGGCADVSRDAAEALMQPLALMELGQRFGKLAAEQAAKLPAPKHPKIAARTKSNKPTASSAMEVLLPADSLAIQRKPYRFVSSEGTALPVLGQYDVVVVGGGTAGAPAGIGAARQGAKTLVIEYLNHLGGIGTVGMISRNWYGRVCGFAEEADRAVAINFEKPEFHDWDIEEKSEWMRQELRKAGGRLWYGAMVCGVLCKPAEGNVNGKGLKTVCGVVVLTPQGRGVVLAKTVIDATGNADVARSARSPLEFMGGGSIALQGVGLSPRAPGQRYNNSDWTIVDDSDVYDRTRAHVVATAKFRECFDISPLIASRERWRIVSDYMLTPTDIFRERQFADVICEPRDNFDQHGYTVDPLCRLAFPLRKEVVEAQFPYRSILPVGLDELLVVGVGMGVHRDSLPIVRTQPDIQNVGYAAGLAAALARKDGVTVRTLDVPRLQQVLVAKKLIRAASLPKADTPRATAADVNAALEKLVQAKSLTDLPALRLYAMIFDAGDADAVPALKVAHDRTEKAELKIVLAEILAMRGNAHGAETLLAALRDSSAWDVGWRFQGQANHGAGYSRLDSIILDLASIDCKPAVPLIIEKLKLLDAKSEFSHFRCCALALEKLRDPSAATALAAKLAEEGIAGHTTSTLAAAHANAPVPPEAYANQNESKSREVTLRELLLASALLACGDHQNQGRKIVEQYAQDVHAIYRVYAQRLLEKTGTP